MEKIDRASCDIRSGALANEPIRICCDRIIQPVAILLLSIVLFATLGSRSCLAEDITLRWDPSPSAKVAGYKVHARKADGGYYAVEDVGNVTQHIVRGLSKDEKYMFSITAYDAGGFESHHSNAVSWGSRSSDIGALNSVSGCLIAEVAYGNHQAREVLLLKRFRDRFLETNALGRLVIHVYEGMSPPMADLARRNEAFRTMTRWGLAPVVCILEHLRGFAVLAVSFTAVLAIGLVYYRRRKKISIPYPGHES